MNINWKKKITLQIANHIIKVLQFTLQWMINQWINDRLNGYDLIKNFDNDL